MKEIQVRNVNFCYPNGDDLFRQLSFNVSLDGNKGKVYSILGSSGIGKTTLLKLFSKSIRPLSGKIDTVPSEPRISYLPQQPVLFDHLSIEENIRYFERIKSLKEYFDPLYTKKLISLLGLNHIINYEQSISNISGGQKQRIALARALSIKPDLLLLDEPTNGLNGLVKQDFITTLKSLLQEQCIITFYVTHQLDEAKYISDEVLYLSKSVNGITDIIHSKTFDFFSKPPLLEAALEIGFPNSNKLRCILDQDRICLASDLQEESFYLFIKNENIDFSDTSGWTFKIEIINELFTRIELTNEQTITTDLPSPKNTFVTLKGDVLRYNLDGKYMDTLKVNSNKIV